jgi:hypothetical protein
VKTKTPDDEGWGGEILARYERGVMLFLFILAVTIVGLIVWLGLISSAYNNESGLSGLYAFVSGHNGSMKFGMLLSCLTIELCDFRDEELASGETRLLTLRDRQFHDGSIGNYFEDVRCTHCFVSSRPDFARHVTFGADGGGHKLVSAQQIRLSCLGGRGTLPSLTP